MFQFSTPSTEGFFLINNIVRLNIYDKFTSTNLFRPLWVLKSQFTKKEKKYTSDVNYTNKERFVEMKNTTVIGIDETPVSGFIKLGTTDFPLGFYDVSIYENTSNINLDPTGLNLLYTGLMNLVCKNGTTLEDTPPVLYKEYTENNTDTETVYLTLN
jgi:hypothetical protein